MSPSLPLRPHHPHWPSRLPRVLDVPRTSLSFNLEVTRRRHGDRTACVYFGRRFTWAELHAQVQALAGWLQHVGVHAGDRVLLFMQNSPQFIVAVQAILRANAVVVPVNPMNREQELGHCIRDSEARAAITSIDLAGVVDRANAALPPGERLAQLLVTRAADALPPRIDAQEAGPPAMMDWLLADAALPAGATRWSDALGAGHEPGPHDRGPDDLAFLPYTSGTTGLPKGCMHPHRTLMHNVVGGSLWGCVTTESVGLGVVPMFHITGLVYGALAPVFSGSTVVIMPRWDRELAARLIERHRVTHWTCIPTMIIDLLGSPRCAEFDLRSLKYLSGGGAAMPQAVAERLQREFGLVFAEGYGLTETAAPTHANPPERAKLQCLGMPFFGTDSIVVDPETLAPLPPGEVGEIVTHGPMLFDGYWRQPQASAAAFVEIEGRRYFRTGDLGRMDEEGYFYLTDRLKRMINASGYKVWPSEVELMLFKCPLVQEACVVAARDPYRGETVKAFVVLREAARGSAREEDIVAWAREHMAAYKVPRLVEFVDSLPKSGSGKVMWRLLQERERAATPAR